MLVHAPLVNCLLWPVDVPCLILPPHRSVTINSRPETGCWACCSATSPSCWCWGPSPPWPAGLSQPKSWCVCVHRPCTAHALTMHGWLPCHACHAMPPVPCSTCHAMLSRTVPSHAMPWPARPSHVMFRGNQLPTRHAPADVGHLGKCGQHSVLHQPPGNRHEGRLRQLQAKHAASHSVHCVVPALQGMGHGRAWLGLVPHRQPTAHTPMQVIRQKDSASIHAGNAVMSIVNCSLW